MTILFLFIAFAVAFRRAEILRKELRETQKELRLEHLRNTDQKMEIIRLKRGHVDLKEEEF